MTVQHDEQRVDELRKQLRALGYLDAGVDRFVLGPAQSARSPWSIAALSSLRVGLIAAALLGPAAAIGIRTRLPGLVTGTQDAIVIALYLAVLFGVTAIAFSLAASMAVARLAATADAARARFLSRAAGTLVAIGCLAYLTLWWGSTNAEVWSSPGWTAAALVIAVIVSILLGHAVAITTFAVIAARHPTTVSAVTTPPTSARLLVVAAGIIAFAGAAGLLVVAAPNDETPHAQQPLAVVSPGFPVLLVAIDGVDPAILESLRSEGRIPNLSRLSAAGMARVAADDSQDPARAWTTIATGQPPELHGVHTLETRRVAGLEGSVASGEDTGVRRAIRGATDLLRLTRPSVASGTELRVKPLWEIAAESGLRVIVVNWWATWPAVGSGPNAAEILSDRAVLRLEHGGALDAEIAPPELYEQLRSKWPAIKKGVADEVGRLTVASSDAAITAVTRRSAELDALQFAMVSELPILPGKVDLFAVYLPGLDIAQHTLLSAGDGMSASTLAARLDAVRAYYVYLDKLLDGLLDARQTIVVLITQPGRLATRSHGLLAIHGDVTGPSITGELRPTDIAPTVLHALGLPVSRELAGRAVTELFSPEFVAKFPVREVSTYGRRRPHVGVREGQPLDEEMVERLRSLGYVR